MMFLVVDPGIVAWAYAIFTESGKYVKSETIKYSSKQSQEERLWAIYMHLTQLDYIFSHVVIERQFVDIMSQITGVLRAVAGSKTVKTSLYAPREWRKTLTGTGMASEELVKQKVLEVYPEFADKSEHEIDTGALFIVYRRKNGKP